MCCITSGQPEEDERAPLVTVAFPFFRLPFDIRWMIYKEVFKTPYTDNIITPDPSHHRRQLGRRYGDRTVNYDLALLRSCQQAHEEATSFLYGNNIFYFDDADYGIIEIEASAHCDYCLEEASINRDRPGSLTPDIRCSDALDGKHYVEIPRCDLGSMYDWLDKIGQKNRLKIRHIQICFYGCQFARILGEGHDVDDPLKPAPVGGDLIEKALELLGRGHNLDTFGVSFRQRYLNFFDLDWVAETQTWERMTNATLNWTAFERLFSNGLDHRLKNAFSNIKGIRALTCDLASVTPQPSGSWSDEGAHALEGFKEVKECMETGYTDRQIVETSEQILSIPYVDQSRYTIHDCKRLATISSGNGPSRDFASPLLQPETLRLPARASPLLWTIYLDWPGNGLRSGHFWKAWQRISGFLFSEY